MKEQHHTGQQKGQPQNKELVLISKGTIHEMEDENMEGTEE